MNSESIPPTFSERLRRILPLYAAGYGVILCALGSYVSTDADDSFGASGILLVLVGLLVSLVSRLKNYRQNAMFGVLAGLMVFAFFWASLTGGAPWASVVAYLNAGRSAGPGLVLAWFLTMYAFAMISDEVIVFSIVPSMALLGLMASENLNPEVVVYFLGMVLCSVFMLVYESMLSRGLVGTEPDSNVSGRMGPGVLRTPLLLSMGVLALALVVGAAGSLPLRFVGEKIGQHSPSLTVPSSPAFLREAQRRYINQLELSGAPPRLGDQLVMHVQTQTPRGGIAPLYWRGKVFDSYTGSSWTSRTESRQMPARGLTFFATPLRNGADGEMKGRVPLTQVYRLYTPPLGDVLSAAGEPESITLLPGRRYTRESRTGYRRAVADYLLQDAYRAVSVVRSRANLRYRVSSYYPLVTGRDLRKAGRKYPPLVMWQNTSFDEVDPTVREKRRRIALEVTAGARTPYDKVTALTRWLQQNFDYTLTPPRPPRTADAVLFFLEESKQGYCEIFASSLAVLCRELGIPARLATGFATGEVDPTFAQGPFAPVFQPGRQADDTTVFAVRERDLHAWTEVYFPGYGWVPFDPTSSRSADSPMWASLKESFRDLFQRAAGRGAGPSAVMLAFALVLLYLVKSFILDAAAGSLWWRLVMVRWRNGQYSSQRWDLLYERSAGRLTRCAGRRHGGETPHEYAARVGRALPRAAASSFQSLTELYTRAAYRHEAPSPVEFATLKEEDRRLRRSLQRRRLAAEPAPA